LEDKILLDFLSNMDKNDREKYFFDFLKKNQPLPSDEEITQEQLTIYDESRKFFEENHNKDCIKFFLNSFGKGSGYGIYQLIENLISKFHVDEILEDLVNALSNENGSIQY